MSLQAIIHHFNEIIDIRYNCSEIIKDTPIEGDNPPPALQSAPQPNIDGNNNNNNEKVRIYLIYKRFTKVYNCQFRTKSGVDC